MKFEYRRLKINTLFAIIIIILFFIHFVSCKKYLDKRPNKTLYVPTTLQDLQALLDNNADINHGKSPSHVEALADNYYIFSTTWEFGVSQSSQLNYVWNDNGTGNTNWVDPYRGPIYYSNVVLGVLPNIKIDATNENVYNTIKGSALFNRAFTFYQLAQVYCNPYSETANTDLGIVLRLTADILEPVKRSTVQETYIQIINDLKLAAELLPEMTVYAARPNKAAAYGALSRTYLSMHDYINAAYYANLSLQKSSLLLDYNNLNDLVNNPFNNINNPEISYIHTTFNVELLAQEYAIIDSSLYQSYDINDKRKTVFFIMSTDDNEWHFKGSYHGFNPGSVFDGITTSEMYLIRAECAARAGLKDSALADLNRLMVKRWKNNGTWVPITALSAENALQQILIERRKELVFRGIRWSDIRRLNKEGANITLKRMINGVEYALLPSDHLRWVMLIPLVEVSVSGIEQNPR